MIDELVRKMRGGHVLCERDLWKLANAVRDLQIRADEKMFAGRATGNDLLDGYGHGASDALQEILGDSHYLFAVDFLDR